MAGKSEGRESGAGSRSRGGPGWLVAAAFIGPGTVTTATLAGARFGTVLLWALLFSTVATMVLQEMSARLGLVTGEGLGEAVRRRFDAPLLRGAAVFLVVGAIAVGNAAYETGNLIGGSLGIEAAVGGDVRLWAVLVGALSAALLWSGSYKAVERAMMGMVGLMSLAFLATALRVFPGVGVVLEGLFVPRLPEGSLVVALGLVGTTVVPYNLFLHASAVRERWSGADELGDARKDLALSIAVGGAVSMAIVLTSAGTIYAGPGGTVESAADMARQLDPLGGWARVLFAAGLFAAGMTSSITAPLAAAYATAGALGWERDLRSTRFRAVWCTVLGIGVLLAVVGLRPVPAILFAQAMNGILLPAVAVFLLLAANDRRWMGRFTNGVAANVAAGVVVAVALLLGVRALLGVVSSL